MQTMFNTQSQSSSGASDVGANIMGGTPSELFTTLLVAQIRNQNPLEPTDPGEFVGQLTQLSQMEALQKLVMQGTVNASMLGSLQILSLGAQVGSDVAVRTDHATFADKPVAGRFTLEAGSPRVTLVLGGVGGQEHRVELGTRAAGEVPFEIDPVDAGLPAGVYSLHIETEGGESPAIDIFGELHGLRVLADGGVALTVANLGEVPSSAISGFNGRRNHQPG